MDIHITFSDKTIWISLVCFLLWAVVYAVMSSRTLRLREIASLEKFQLARQAVSETITELYVLMMMTGPLKDNIQEILSASSRESVDLPQPEKATEATNVVKSTAASPIVMRVEPVTSDTASAKRQYADANEFYKA